MALGILSQDPLLHIPYSIYLMGTTGIRVEGLGIRVQGLRFEFYTF